MKKNIFLLAIALLTFSCAKNDEAAKKARVRAALERMQAAEEAATFIEK